MRRKYAGYTTLPLLSLCGIRYPHGGSGKIAFDNHLEGSSIKRYSEVAEAMTTLQYHPIEETGDATIRWD